MKPYSPVCSALTLALVARALMTPVAARAQQRNDSLFDASVSRPAHTTAHPRVLIDAGHNNAFSKGQPGSRRIDPFITLLTNDGFQPEVARLKFDAGVISEYPIAVITTAQCLPASDSTCGSAFTDEEIQTVRRWIQNGGRLLLCADHFPFDRSAQGLAAALGATIGDGLVEDSTHFDRGEGHPTDLGMLVSALLFARTDGLIGTHAIITGRGTAERVDSVILFGGSSVTGPPNSIPLLLLSRFAVNVKSPISWPGLSPVFQPDARNLGRAAAVAFILGKGRVVITGDATWLTAQRVTAPPYDFRLGMARRDSGDKQFALNIMRWLSDSTP